MAFDLHRQCVNFMRPRNFLSLLKRTASAIVFLWSTNLLRDKKSVLVSEYEEISA